MASSRKKSEFLGMPFGTATHRLRKMVLFSILKRHGENICYACGNLIESVEELSMEHKEQWEGRNSDLFWDVNNIAFSHRACNRPHLIPGGSGAWRKKQWAGRYCLVRSMQRLSLEKPIYGRHKMGRTL